ncbi:mitochondrial carrier [Neoconidiobolus thromboides FSU 785]|nr:mitochondrial carrier [Neoconidiobolus thromboides FSU 785]
MSNNTDSLRAVKDCTAGSVGGIFQVLAGQPFDTIKVRLQTQPTVKPGELPKYNGALDAVIKTFKQEGPSAFYKGTSTPLVGIGLCVSIQFFSLEAFKRYFMQKNQTDKLSLNQLFLAGAGSGLANSIVSGPVEHIRTRLQVQSSGQKEYNGPIDAIKKIYNKEGIRGIYKGQVATIYREFIGYGAYFAAYEYLVQKEIEKTGLKRDQLSSLTVCKFGALAGYSMWLLAYPIDCVKSKIQTDGFTKADRKYSSIMNCIKITYKQQGIKGFFNGFLPCILRAAPANAATFLGFEMAMRVLN